MRKIILPMITALCFVFTSQALYAQAAVGVIPFTGDEADRSLLEMRVRETLPRDSGISVIADSMMKQIIEIHEKAQSLGSGYHDISKMKVAEYIITGSVTSGKANVKVIDVNSATEVVNRFADFTGDRDYHARKIAREIRDAIILHSSSKGRETPEDVKPYMEIIERLAASLGSGDEASYPVLAFYTDGSYKTPRKGDKGMEEKAAVFLKVIRPNLLRARLSYAGKDPKSPWMYITVIADKLGKKTRHKFGIIELESGALAVGIYELLQ
jgi:hypothetical protein